MTSRRLLIAVLVGAGFVAAGATAYAQGGKPSVQQAVIDSDRYKYNWKDNTFEFLGNCKVEIKGPDRAVMNSPKMVGKAGKGNQISQITATGPVRFDITTAKDEEGVQRIIRAACAGSATYRGGDRIVTLSGGAEAGMTTVPEDPNIQPGKLTAGTLTINLDTFEIEGDKFHGEMQFVPTDEKKAP
jgi:hypothetical protein